eukprot:6134558-Pleurochrysis_carterae.AAC.2
MLDMRVLVQMTYELEGDRLEMLLVHDHVEQLHQLGYKLAENADGALPNLNALLRAKALIDIGTKIKKARRAFFTSLRVRFLSALGPLPRQRSCCRVQLAAVVNNCNSTLHPGRTVTAYRVFYMCDGTFEDVVIEELRPLITVTELPERKRKAGEPAKAFAYLEDRLTGACDAIFSCAKMYEVCRVVLVFIPSYAVAHLAPTGVDALAIVPSVSANVDINKLKQEMPAYLAAAAAAAAHILHDDVGAFTAMAQGGADRLLNDSKLGVVQARLFTGEGFLWRAAAVNDLRRAASALLLRFNKRKPPTCLGLLSRVLLP